MNKSAVVQTRILPGMYKYRLIICYSTIRILYTHVLYGLMVNTNHVNPVKRKMFSITMALARLEGGFGGLAPPTNIVLASQQIN